MKILEKLYGKRMAKSTVRGKGKVIIQSEDCFLVANREKL